jgi:hypothetical protein
VKTHGRGDREPGPRYRRHRAVLDIRSPRTGGLPEPAVRRDRASLFLWAEVAAWLAWSKLGEADATAAELAQACRVIDAALTVRDGLRDLPSHSRPLIRDLVA